MASEAPSILRDTPARYGLVTRILHWVMAYLLVWQFFVALSWLVLGKGAFVSLLKQIGLSHPFIGLLALALVLPRGLWALANRADRPPAEPTPAGLAARLVHSLLYLLIFVVPALAFARAYGSGKGLVLSGWSIIPATGVTRPWIVAPADLLHSPLAWLLAVLIAGHMVMACVHGFVLRDGIFGRMAGRLRC